MEKVQEALLRGVYPIETDKVTLEDIQVICPGCVSDRCYKTLRKIAEENEVKKLQGYNFD